MNVATNKLKQKNRKQNKITIMVPLNLDFESGTTWSMSGFMPDIDSQLWLLSEVQHRVAGKSGSETTLSFTQVPNLTNNPNVIGVHQASAAQIAAATANAHAAGY